MKDCKPPTCVYSKNKNKCIKPNSYIQFIANCKDKGHTADECKNNYKSNKEQIKENACVYYEENKKVRYGRNSCPKKRTPIGDKCPAEFKVLKLNKYKVKCCYKELVKKHKARPPREISSFSRSLSPFTNDEYISPKTSKKLTSPNVTTNYENKKISSSPNSKNSKKLSSEKKNIIKPLSNVFKDIQNERVLNKKGKISKVLYKYQNKEKSKKVL